MFEGSGFYDDDGNELNTDLIPKPQLCLSCKKNDDPNEHFLCGMTRLDQKDDEAFICYAYDSLTD